MKIVVCPEGLSSEQGKPIDPEFLTGLRLHDMRHEATSRLFEDKHLQTAEVMAVTGHKDMRSLMRYTHLQPHQLAKKLGQPLRSN